MATRARALAQQQATFNRNTRAQLKHVADALRDLMTPPEPGRRICRCHHAATLSQPGYSAHLKD
ncbi:MAG: hypothetical protein AABZ19_12450 [Pseudomonadota bacterium]